VAREAAGRGGDDWDLDEVDSSINYGDDGEAPTPDIALGPDLPDDADDRTDEDPASRCVFDEDQAPSQPVHNIVGVKFDSAGRIYSYDGGDGIYARGDQVLVDSDRGPRIGTVATRSSRRPHGGTRLKRVMRHPDKNDRRALERGQLKEAETLAAARAAARALELPIKVFRAELAHSGPSKAKARVYFTSEERVDFRDLVRELSRTQNLRVEMRQIGVRDQAKMVGGIGSCGMELCCSTWLPEFVPVSIKNAKDQGLVLNPSKVSGQCGRLKCCLVYEQETYAALRKGLPKLGKRVITEVGEGRVVEVDVLRQRVRVSHPGGEVAVFGKDEVKPLFPSQQQSSGKPRGAHRQERRPDEPTGQRPDESAATAPDTSPASDPEV
jgi:cell fate regulator YaaT (PSP1 superfamily)